MRLPRRAAVIVAALALLTPFNVVAVQSAPASAAEQVTYRVMTWNVAGWKLHRGSTTNGLARVVANAAQNANVDFFALNELCRGQYDAVVAELRNRNWMQDPVNFARFEKTNPTGDDGSCNYSQSGIAIFSKVPFGNATRLMLPDDGRMEKRKLLCAPPQNRPTVKFCTTHITHLGTGLNGVPNINRLQLDFVLARMEEFEASGHTVLIAGDFNAQPHYGRINQWYSTTLDHPNNHDNTGRYRELDDTDSRCYGYGETTSPAGHTGGLCDQGKKLDLIFVRDNKYVGAYDSDSVSISNECGGPCSDHRHVWGSVTVLA